MARRDRTQAGDDGSAVAEFALVAALLSLVLLTVLQLALAVHVRNTLVAAAADGARLAATRGHTPGDGVVRTREMVTTALSPAYASAVAARRTAIAGVPAIVLEIRAPLPLLGLAGPSGTMDIEAHALMEQP